jgi:hypothetical protein
MIRKASIGAAVLVAAAAGNLAWSQAPAPTILTIDLTGYTEYQADIYDASKYGKNSDKTPSTGTGAFGVATILGDIVAVNGQPAKGLYVGRSRAVGASPTPTPGQSPGDTTATALREHVFKIMRPDGTQIGTIVSLGFSGGDAPPGAPSGGTGGDWAIVGGTGAFLGARGQMKGWGGTPFAKANGASMAEDPINRLVYHAAATWRFTLHIIPMSRPEVVMTSNGPAVTHSRDFTLVSLLKPATAGEVLSLFATGLGPVRAGVDPGLPFPSSPLAVVNSPVEVTVNGMPAEVLGAVGYPGSVDGYQINFRVPPDTAKGAATIQLTAAWVSGSPATIVVQ